MDKELIRQTMATKGWGLIVEMFNEELINLTLARNLKGERQDIALEALSSYKAAKIGQDFINKLNRINDNIEAEPKRYI